MVHWIKHAFAVEPTGSSEPSAAQRAVVERVCVEVVRRHLAAPAVMFLETARPLNFLGAQVMHFFAPFLSALTGAEGYKHFAAFLEQRGSIDYITGRIEALEADASSRDRTDGR